MFLLKISATDGNMNINRERLFSHNLTEIPLKRNQNELISTMSALITFKVPPNEHTSPTSSTVNLLALKIYQDPKANRNSFFERISSTTKIQIQNTMTV